MPASVTSSTRSPAGRASTQLGGAARLVALEVRHDPAGDARRRGRREPAQPPGVLGGDHVGAARAPRASRGGASATRPIGVAASTSTPSSTASILAADRDRLLTAAAAASLDRRPTVRGLLDARAACRARWQRARQRTAALGDRSTVAGPSRSASRWWRSGMRLWRLGQPDRFAFDETYYAKDGGRCCTTATCAATRSGSTASASTTRILDGARRASGPTSRR